MIMHAIILAFVSLMVVPPHEVSETEQSQILSKVNAIRAHGCYCGDEFMQPVGSVEWNDKLYASALHHARQMDRFGYFGHYGPRGEDIGQRLDAVDYLWEVAGENLGEGQKSFEEVLRDWIDSESHCRMLMNPRVTEMAVAKYSKYWVQHWGKQLPPGAVPHE